ncbi:MAG: CHAT domain-containing protein [Saprospiraceae bacterium]
MEETVSNLKTQIANGNLEIALNELISDLGGSSKKTTYLNDAIAIKSRLNQHNRSVIRGTLGYGEQVLEKNQIAFALLDLLSKIYTENEVNEETKRKSDGNSLTSTITILFVTANPEQTARLRLDEEMRDIEEELRKAKFRDKFTIVKKNAARIGELQDGLLDYNPDIIHFSGHGTNQGIILHGPENTNMTVNNESLAQLFRLFSDKLACVFLSSCYSEIQGQIINQHIPNVIGMKDKVPQETAIAFAKAFYKSLGAGRNIDFSFEFAKISVGLNNLAGENIPIFLQR